MPAPTPVAETTSAPTSVNASTRSAPVSDAAWKAVEGKNVEVTTPSGPKQGELASSEGDSIVLIAADGEVQTIPKAQASGVKVVKAPSPASEMASLEAGPEPPPEDGARGEESGEEDEELTPAQQRRKERREKREHALLGAFTMHGATYSHWRGNGINAGHASYAMDWGIGANFSPSFGMYAMVGGVYGARIDNKTVRANSTHIAALFAFGGKYYYSTVGAGVGFNRLRFPDPRGLEKDVGLSLPFKLVGKIPLPKKLYIGLGLTYEFGAYDGFSRYLNAIGGQIVFGRW